MDKVSFAIAVVALLVALSFRLWSGGSDPAPSIEANRIETAQRAIVRTEQELAGLQSQLANVVASLKPPETGAAPGAPATAPASGPSIRDLLERIGELEQRVESLLANRATGDQVQDPGQVAQAMAELRQDVLDPTLADEVRVEAAGKLRWLEAGAGNRNDGQTAGAVLEILGRSKKDDVRLAAIRSLRGLTLPKEDSIYHQVYTSLGAILQADSGEKLREEAAQSLAQFRDEPFVRGLIEQSLAAEKSYRVRFELERGLRGER